MPAKIVAHKMKKLQKFMFEEPERPLYFVGG